MTSAASRPARWASRSSPEPPRETPRSSIRSSTSPSAAPPYPDAPAVIPETGFRIATYNVLGYHLTAPGGGRPGWGNGASRVAAGKAKLEASGVDIVVLNEFESPQAAVFQNDPEWELYRADPNNVFRNGNSGGNAIAWKRADWKLVETTEFLVPYKTTLHMPVVTLENLDTGAVIRVIAVHNPASTGQGRQPAGGPQHRPGHRAGRDPGAARRGPGHPHHHRRRHERAGDRVLLVHRHRVPPGLGRRLGRRRRAAHHGTAPSTGSSPPSTWTSSARTSTSRSSAGSATTRSCRRTWSTPSTRRPRHPRRWATRTFYPRELRPRDHGDARCARGLRCRHGHRGRSRGALAALATLASLRSLAPADPARCASLARVALAARISPRTRPSRRDPGPAAAAPAPAAAGRSPRPGRASCPRAVRAHSCAAA